MRRAGLRCRVAAAGAAAGAASAPAWHCSQKRLLCRRRCQARRVAGRQPADQLRTVQRRQRGPPQLPPWPFRRHAGAGTRRRRAAGAAPPPPWPPPPALVSWPPEAAGSLRRCEPAHPASGLQLPLPAAQLAPWLARVPAPLRHAAAAAPAQTWRACGGWPQGRALLQLHRPPLAAAAALLLPPAAPAPRPQCPSAPPASQPAGLPPAGARQRHAAAAAAAAPRGHGGPGTRARAVHTRVPHAELAGAGWRAAAGPRRQCRQRRHQALRGGA